MPPAETEWSATTGGRRPRIALAMNKVTTWSCLRRHLHNRRDPRKGDLAKEGSTSFVRVHAKDKSHIPKIPLSSQKSLVDDGKFLLAARRSHRPAGTEYLISLDAKNTSKGTYIGKLR